MDQVSGLMERTTLESRNVIDLPQAKSDLEPPVVTTSAKSSITASTPTDPTITSKTTCAATDVETKNGSEEQDGRHPCATCSKLTKNFCAACYAVVANVSGVERAFYCSKECQTNDWPSHKSTCKTNRNIIDRYALRNAAKFLQSAFYAFREEAFDLSIQSLQWIGDTLLIREGQYGPADILVPFPRALIEGMDEKTRPMLLSLASCNDSVIFSHDICHMLLIGTKLAKKIEQVTFEAKRGCQDFVFLRNGNVTVTATTHLHCIYRITLRDSSTWSVDLTGAQFGDYNPCQPWNEYCKERAGLINTKLPFGGNCESVEQRCLSVLSNSTQRDSQMMIMRAEAQVAEAMVNGIRSGFRKEKVDAQKLLTGLKEADFGKVSQSIIESSVRKMRTCKIDVARRGGFIRTARVPLTR